MAGDMTTPPYGTVASLRKQYGAEKLHQSGKSSSFKLVLQGPRSDKEGGLGAESLSSGHQLNIVWKTKEAHSHYHHLHVREHAFKRSQQRVSRDMSEAHLVSHVMTVVTAQGLHHSVGDDHPTVDMM